MQEMAASWQMTVDSKMGLFSEDKPRKDPFVFIEGMSMKPDPPYIIPHDIWSKVRLVINVARFIQFRVLT